MEERINVYSIKTIDDSVGQDKVYNTKLLHLRTIRTNTERRSEKV